MKKFTLLIFVSLLSFFSYGQLALEEFEAPWTSGTPAAPTGWTVVNEQGPAVTWARSPLTGPSAIPYQGTYAAFLERENVLPNQATPRDWLITPYFNMPANAQLRFFSRLTQTGDQGSIYKIKISTDADPSNLSAYQDLQTWTEFQINPVQTQYTEKILTLPNTITGDVHIAFVMEGVQKDRWLIDNVRVVSQCNAPTTLAVSDITLTTAKFDWVNTSGAPSWQIEIVPDNQNPVEGGVTFTGPPTYTATLLPDTVYKAYVRAKCADGGESNWIGPVFFSTGKIGEHCNYPIVIPGAPYSTTDNTSAYADNYEATGTTGCNATGNYISGNDVVYSFTPAANGNYNIGLSGAGTGAGVFVYNSCANIGVNCVNGVTGNASIASVALTGGTTYYIVVSSSTAALTTPYTLNIQQVFCTAPTGLATANATASSVDINWAAGAATEWQFAIQPAGAGLPTGAGQNVTSNTITATQATNGALAPSSSYDVYVRAACGDGNYSIWTGPVNFLTTQIPDTITYLQDWEGATHSWTLSNGTQPNKWVVGSATQNGGTKSLYISNDSGVNNTYTINAASTVHAYRDVIIPPTATSLNLAFDWKSIGETNDNIRVYLIPTSVTPVPGTQITNATPNIRINPTNLFGGTSWATFNGVINVTGLGSTTRRLVFEWVNNAATGSQSPAAIDNINLSVITCPAPTNPIVVANSLTSSQVDISWTAPTSVPPGYDYYMNTTGAAPTATSVTGTSATTSKTGIAVTPSATHYFWVRANCGPGDTSTWAGPLTFIAPQIPAILTYAQNFDNTATPHGWSLNNGTQANKWVVGAATSNSAANSLYISNDNAVTNAYNNTSTSTVQAYRDITVPAGTDQILLTYDWKSVGETADYFRVWIVPVTFNPTAGTLITANANQVQIVPNTFGGNPTAWTTQTVIIQAAAYANSDRRIIFEWRNDGANGATPPAAIDNINISVIQCPQPSALTLGSVVSGSANFSWTAPVSGAPGYEYFITTDTALVPTAATVETGDNTSTSLNVPGLPASTVHNLWVRSDCGGSKSLWIGPLTFTTPQTPSPMNYSQNFDGTTHDIDFRNGNLANKWAVGSATSNSGANSMYISNDGGVNNGYTFTSAGVVHAYKDIQLPGAVDQVLLSFDWKSVGETADYFRVWLVPVDYILPVNAQITTGTGRLQIGGNFTGNNAWTTFNNIFSALAYQGQAMRLVFEWRNDTAGGTQTPAAIDNINFSVVTCPAPTNLAMTSNTLSGTTFTWTPPSSVTPTFDFYYSPSPTPPTGATTPSGNSPSASVTLSGLPDSSNLFFWVRDNCGPGDTSLWLGPFAFNTPQVASPLNYTQNFDGNTHGWTINNGNQTNKWMVGTATSNSASRSLYVTENYVSNTYNFTAGSVVHAYKDFTIPAGTANLDLSFDWKNAGQAASDYIRVWRVPVTFVPTPGTNITAAADRVQIAASLVSNANWTTFNNVFDATTLGTSTRIVFEWVNNTFTGTNPPGAIDNIDLTAVTCPKPTGLGVSAITQTGATFNWTEAGTATNWEVYVIPAGQPAPNAASEGVAAGTNPYTYTTPALQPSTNYVYYVRAICAGSDESKWAGPFPFRTSIGNDECSGATVLTANPYTTPCQSSAMASYTGATPSPQPFDCQATNGADIWFEFVATNERHNIELSDFAIWQNTSAQPIVIALYEGDQCDVMSQLGCSITNVFVGKNLNIGSTYRFRLMINSATPSLNTTFKVCVNTPAPPDVTNTDACTVTTINHSFEQPIRPDLTVPPSPYPFQISQFIVPGWRTTATDNMMEFWPTPNYEFVPAYEGNTFVELNAEQIAGFYQDYATPQPTTFTYKFAHRGRRGVDTCKLLAGSPNDIYTEVTTASTNNTEWVVYTGTYTSPPGQLVTRFIFQSASTSDPNGSVGNFLDAIEFTADNGVVSFGPEDLTCIDNVLSVVASGSGEWSADPTNPSETIITNPESNTTTITGFRGNGEYRYDWTTQYCKSTIVVNYDNGSVPVPVTTTEIEYCLGATASPLTATALAGHTLNWYTTATGGTASTTAPTPDTSSSNTTIYYVAQQSAVNCESDRVAIEVDVYATVAAPVAQTAYTYCEDVPAIQLTATAVAGHTLNWYTEPTGGTPSAVAPTPSTANGGVTNYYVSQSNVGGCESNRTEIVVTVNPSIIPVTEFSFPNTTICVEDATDPIPDKAPGFAAGGAFTSGVGLIIHPVTGEINLSGSTPGTYTVIYTIMPDEATCNIGGSTSRQITITPLANAVAWFSYNSVCSDAGNQLPALPGDFTTGGTFTGDAGLVIDTATGEINVAATTPGQYDITYNVDQNVATCTAAGTFTTSITITQSVTPVLGFDYDDNFCYNGTDATPTLAAGFSAGGSFSGTPGLVIDSVTGIVDIDSSTPGQHTVTYNYNGDSSVCIQGGSSTAAFTIASELGFDFEGFCDGIVFVVEASPETGEFDDENPSFTFRWTNANGTVIGTDSHILNVSDYAASTPENDTFPMDVSLTVTVNGCETTRTFTVDGIACTVQKGISPNNDGMNDYFDLEFMGVKKLSIYNRYGQEVYTKSGYTNEWRGQADNGNELPTGTYYYVIERVAGGTNTGWIYINRQE